MKFYGLLLILACGFALSTGCALKAPLVTEALPITKIRGMPVEKTPAKPAVAPHATPSPGSAPTPMATTVPAALPTPAVVPTPAPAADSLDATEDAAASAMVGTQTYYFSGSNKLPPLAKELQIQDMSFRSLSADANDQTEDARKNAGLIDQCPGGRGDVDFIKSVVVGVRHKNEKDTEAVVVATYTQTQTGLCGFHLTPTYFDMKDYASDYTFVIQVTGSLPKNALSISGYYTAQDYEGL